VLIGGRGNDRVSDLDLDDSGGLVLGGVTDSSDFPVENAFQSKLAGNNDGFVARLSTSTWNISFATYVGGSQLDAIWGGRAHSAGKIVVSGSSESNDLRTLQRISARPSAKSAAFVASMTSDGQQPGWLSFYAGTGETYGGGMELDQGG